MGCRTVVFEPPACDEAKVCVTFSGVYRALCAWVLLLLGQSALEYTCVARFRVIVNPIHIRNNSVYLKREDKDVGRNIVVSDGEGRTLCAFFFVVKRLLRMQLHTGFPAQHECLRVPKMS